MLKLANVTWVFLQLAGENVEERIKYSVSTFKYFCLLWVPHEKRRPCCAHSWALLCCWPGRKGPRRTSVLRLLRCPLYSRISATTLEGYVELWVTRWAKGALIHLSLLQSETQLTFHWSNTDTSGLFFTVSLP